MEYTPVPAARQEDIKSPQRAAWFAAVQEHGMLQMAARPTLTTTQKTLLEAQGQRLRTRSIDGAFYVWVEDIPASALNEDVPVDDEGIDYPSDGPFPVPA